MEHTASGVPIDVHNECMGASIEAALFRPGHDDIIITRAGTECSLAVHQPASAQLHQQSRAFIPDVDDILYMLEGRAAANHNQTCSARVIQDFLRCRFKGSPCQLAVFSLPTLTEQVPVDSPVTAACEVLWAAWSPDGTRFAVAWGQDVYAAPVLAVHAALDGSLIWSRCLTSLDMHSSLEFAWAAGGSCLVITESGRWSAWRRLRVEAVLAMLLGRDGKPLLTIKSAGGVERAEATLSPCGAYLSTVEMDSQAIHGVHLSTASTTAKW